ncbi:MAG: tetratricopeptide repeat protein [Gemmatimonadota bacterium]
MAGDARTAVGRGMMGLKLLLGEIHGRSLWQLLGIYLGASWLVLQVVGQITEALALPEWIQPLAIILLLLGLPVMLTTAIIQGGPRRPTRALRGPETGHAARAGVAAAASHKAAAPGADGEDPDAVTPPEASATREAPLPRLAERGAHHRLFTWKHALLGGAAAFALLGLITTGYIVLRGLGIGPAGTLVAKGALEAHTRLLVADFASPAADSSLARTVTEAFRIDFSQSAVARVAEPGQVAAALRRMERPPDAALTLELAREVAVREGIPAVIGGEIGRAGTGFLLSARVISVEDGSVLVSHREAAGGADAILPAIDKLSRRLRERIGESLGSLVADKPLAKTTTSDLAALRKYTQAIRAIDAEGKLDRGIALLQEAVARDTAFGMAYRKLGIAFYRKGGQLQSQVENLSYAYELRDRMTERERYITIATYFTYGTYEPERAATAYETLLDRSPDDGYALNNLALIYSGLGDHARAEQLLERSIRTDSTTSISYTNLLFEQVAQRKAAAA